MKQQYEVFLFQCICDNEQLKNATGVFTVLCLLILMG